MKRTFLDLGKQPITNAFLTDKDFKNEYFYNLSIVFDDDSKLVSINEKVEPDKMFNDVYAHRASESQTMRNSFREIALELDKEYKPNKILEIGSNDGVFIRNFDGDKTIAVEPCGNLAKMTNDMGYETYAEFWDIDLAEKIIKKNGKFDIIYSANTISHIEDLDEVFTAVKNSLTTDGIFVFEDPSLYSVMNNVSYDQFYDEHVHVFSVTALNNLLKRNGLNIFRVDNLKVHGGSNRIYAKLDISDRKIETSVSDNLRKGAATNTVQITEFMLANNFI